MWHTKIGAVGLHPLGVANKAGQYSRGQRQDLLLEACAKKTIRQAMKAV